MMIGMKDVTQILKRVEKGDPAATEQLLPLVYHELRRLAAAKMAKESPDHTLQATDLVHEAYIRLVDTSNPQVWRHRGHFFAAAAESMRRILVESARRRAAAKRGGAVDHESLNEAEVLCKDSEELLSIHEVVDQLAAEDRPSADLVKLRYFAGLNMDETAAILGISVRKAHYTWAYARSWLRRKLGDG
jgi:RNA polymerase sigma factor (TIGR02999 family)